MCALIVLAPDIERDPYNLKKPIIVIIFWFFSIFLGISYFLRGEKIVFSYPTIGWAIRIISILWGVIYSSLFIPPIAQLTSVLSWFFNLAENFFGNPFFYFFFFPRGNSFFELLLKAILCFLCWYVLFSVSSFFLYEKKISALFFFLAILVFFLSMNFINLFIFFWPIFLFLNFVKIKNEKKGINHN